MLYRSVGKQVLIRHGSGWAHFADARDSDAADTIVTALNPEPGAPEVDPPDSKHEIRQEADEYACKCGKRWPIDEGRDHP